MSGSESNQRPTIILVKEEAPQREYIADHLTANCFDVLPAEDSDAACELLKTKNDIRGLVTDAHVPGEIDGFELARLVSDQWPEMAVVMMSGHSDASSGPVPDGTDSSPSPT